MTETTSAESAERRSYEDWIAARAVLYWCEECLSGILVDPVFEACDCGEHGPMTRVELTPDAARTHFRDLYEEALPDLEGWRHAGASMRDLLLDLYDDALGDGNNETAKMIADTLREAWNLEPGSSGRLLRRGTEQAPRRSHKPRTGPTQMGLEGGP